MSTRIKLLGSYVLNMFYVKVNLPNSPSQNEPTISQCFGSRVVVQHATAHSRLVGQCQVQNNIRDYLAPRFDLIAATHLHNIDHNLGTVTKTIHMLAYKRINNCIPQRVRHTRSIDVNEPVGIVTL